MRINTRLSPHAQVQFHVPEWRSLGTRLLSIITLFPVLCSLVCVQHNARKWKNGEKRGRPGNTCHMADVKGGRDPHSSMAY